MFINVVLDGPKACGKSTIANELINTGGQWGYIHSDSKTQNDLSYHLGILNEGLRKKQNMILDRFSFGEMIYSRLYNRKCKLTGSQFIDTISNERTVYVVLYSSSIILLKERMERRGRNTEDEELELVSSSNYAFMRYALWLKNVFHNKNNYLTFDVSRYTKEEIIEKIKEKMEEIENEKI